MNILIFNNLLANITIKSLLEMFINSVWIGALLAIISSIILLFIKKSNSNARYYFLYSILILFFIFNVSFLIFSFNQRESSLLNFISNFTIFEKSGFQILVDSFQLLHRKADLIVNVWCFYIVISLLRLSVEITTIVQLKSRQISAVGANWEEKIKELALKFGIKRCIKFYQSAIVKTPLVIGHFKPIILFPLGLLSQLSMAEIEAIIMHELSHIKRNDFIFNIIQKLIEILFFFNPFVWWLSHLIRVERENCCDDLAISFTNNPKSYIQALVSFQEFRMNEPTLAIGFGKNRNQILNRVLRIVKHDNQKYSDLEKSLITLTFSVVCSLIFMSAFIEKPFKSQSVSLSTFKIKNNIIDQFPVISQPSKNAIKVEKRKYFVAKNKLNKKHYDALIAENDEKNHKKILAQKYNKNKRGISIETTNSETHVDDILTTQKSNKTTRYFADSYEVVMNEGKIIGIYFEGNPIPNERIPELSDTISRIIKKAKFQEST